MLSWLNKGIPLPFGAIDNQRSLVAIGNLVDLIVTCIDHPAAANQTFLVSDGEDLSTTQLLRRLAQALVKNARIDANTCKVAIKLAASILGKQAIAQRLCESLQVDISKNREIIRVDATRQHGQSHACKPHAIIWKEKRNDFLVAATSSVRRCLGG